MKAFKLPDLGEGLPDAVIREWYVQPGDVIEAEQTIAAMETAKALVDVPSPFSGTVKQLHGKVGDTINTGDPLISFEDDDSAEIEETKDQGTVVGKIAESTTVLEECATGVAIETDIKAPKILPAYRDLAAALNINLGKIASSQSDGSISTEDFKQAILQQLQVNSTAGQSSEQGETLSPAYRAMVQSMSKSHREVVPVTLCDDVDIHRWFKQQNFMLKLIQAICAACQAEPRLNAQYFSGNEKFWQRDDINIGVAVDSKANGLFVPVIKQANQLSDDELRAKLEEFKHKADTKTFAPDDLKDATIMLSNFGSIAGRYGMPILTPPCVAIIGAGRVAPKLVKDGRKTVEHPVLSVAITADHRVVTGGELARFLQAMLIELG